MWAKALLTLENSQRGLDPAVEFAVACMAALQAATALLYARGYRPYACGYRPSGRDHHHTAFAGAAAVGEGDLRAPPVSSTGSGWVGTRPSMDRQLTVPEEQLQTLREATLGLMREASRRISAERPGLAATLVDPPSS